MKRYLQNPFKISILEKKDEDKLDFEKKELYAEVQQLNNYLDNKLIWKAKERNDIINKYNLLGGEKITNIIYFYF